MRRLATTALCGAVVGAVVVGLAVWTGSPTTPLSFTAALVFSLAAGGAVVLLALRAHRRRVPPFRFGPIELTVLLGAVWLAVSFVLFDRLYNGP